MSKPKSAEDEANGGHLFNDGRCIDCDAPKPPRVQTRGAYEGDIVTHADDCGCSLCTGAFV